MSVRSPEKKQTLLAFLSRGVAMVHLDARRPGVQVPERFKSDAHLRLNLSYRYGLPQFEVGDDGVVATLSFDGHPFHCVLPWDAVFAVTSSGTAEGQVWEADLPIEADRGLTQQQQRRPVEKPRPQLVAVGEEKGRTSHRTRAHDEQSPDDPPDGPKPGGHLRLVR